jgi:hypothetical protein
MNYGNIVLAKTKGEWIANAIEWFTRSRFSHTLVTAPPQAGYEMCIEASGKGIDELNFDTGYRNNPTQCYLLYRVNLPIEVLDAAMRECLDQLEGGYAYLAYPWFMWRTFLKAVCNIDIKHQDNWYKKQMVCSGLVRLFLDSKAVKDYLSKFGQPSLFKDFGQGSVHVEDLFQIFQSNPKLFELIETKGITL